MINKKRNIPILLALMLVLIQSSVVFANEQIEDENTIFNNEENGNNPSYEANVESLGESTSLVDENKTTIENGDSSVPIVNETPIEQPDPTGDGDNDSSSEPQKIEVETQNSTDIVETIPPYTNGNGETVKKTEYYFSTPSGFVKAGTLEKGVILEPTRVTTNYFIIVANKKSYYIPRTSLTSTTEKSNLEKHITGSFPRNIIAETEAPFKDKAGNIIGAIAKGKQVQLHMVNGRQGVIEIFGQRVYVDLINFRHTNQIIPKKNISFKEMEYHLKVFSYMYPEFTRLEKIGSSVQGRTIYALKVGKGTKEILMDASMHAREHMTTNVLLEMIDEYSAHYISGTKFGSLNVQPLLNKVSIWFVPMMNPDAVTLVQSHSNANATTKKLNNGSTDYNRWKANIRGVDLNRNFSVGWTQKVTIPRPSYKNYKGPTAFSEPESRALKSFMANHKFKSYISYHSAGQVLYYFNFQNAMNLKRDYNLVKKFNNVTGYKIMPPTGQVASGVSADYFISTYKMPGITVEIAPYVTESVVPLKYWDNVWKKNKTIGLIAANEASVR